MQTLLDMESSLLTASEPTIPEHTNHHPFVLADSTPPLETLDITVEKV